MSSIAHFVVGRWRLIATLAFGVTLVAAIGVFSPRGSGPLKEVSAAYKVKSELDGEFGSDGGECLLVVDVAEGNLFSPDRLEVVRELELAVEGTDWVEDVLSLGDIKVVNWLGLPTSLLPRAGGDMAKARERAVAHPFGGGQLLAEDARTLIMPVRFTREAMEAVSYHQKQRSVRAAVESVEVPAGVRVRLTGLYALWEAEQAAVKRDQFKFILIGMVLASLLAIYFFRSVWVAAAIGGPAFLGVFWAFGLLTFLIEEPTSLTQVVMPLMLVMVGFTDAVHLMFHIRRARCAGHSRAQAAITAVRELGLPCALTSLTTAVGFGSLMVAEAEVIRSFGMSCAIGVVLTFLAVVTLVPLLSMTWLARNVHLSEEHDFMQKHRGLAERVVGFLLRRARWVVVGSALLMVL
ncbi:MAG: putative RND superfamily exporter protein, partial [Verrucomicrobiales bacterium]